jgi:6,7-dimethyl-8-ribityllumazine synthase
MASALHNLSVYDDTNVPAADELVFGIVVSEWNAQVTRALYAGCLETLLKHGAREENIHVIQVPGAFELPVGARIISGQHNLDSIICLGCVIKGDTSHDEYINHAVATGLVTLGVTTGKPYIFGLLTTNNEQQALDRAGGKHGNKGIEAAVTAIRMGVLKKGGTGSADKRRIGF